MCSLLTLSEGRQADAGQHYTAVHVVTSLSVPGPSSFFNKAMHCMCMGIYTHLQCCGKFSYACLKKFFALANYFRILYSCSNSAASESVCDFQLSSC